MAVRKQGQTWNEARAGASNQAKGKQGMTTKYADATTACQAARKARMKRAETARRRQIENDLVLLRGSQAKLKLEAAERRAARAS